jgi:hypothetical protein
MKAPKHNYGDHVQVRIGKYKHCVGWLLGSDVAPCEDGSHAEIEEGILSKLNECDRLITTPNCSVVTCHSKMSLQRLRFCHQSCHHLRGFLTIEVWCLSTRQESFKQHPIKRYCACNLSTGTYTLAKVSGSVAQIAFNSMPRFRLRPSEYRAATRLVCFLFTLSYPVMSVCVRDYVTMRDPANCRWVVFACEEPHELFFGRGECSGRIGMDVGHAEIICGAVQRLQHCTH